MMVALDYVEQPNSPATSQEEGTAMMLTTSYMVPVILQPSYDATRAVARKELCQPSLCMTIFGRDGCGMPVIS